MFNADLSSDGGSNSAPDEQTGNNVKARRGPVIMPSGLPDPMPGRNVIVNDPALIKSLRLDISPEKATKFRRENVPIYRLKTLPVGKRVSKHNIFAIETDTDPRVEKWIKERSSTKGTKKGRTQDVNEVQYVSKSDFQHIVEPDQNAETRDSGTDNLKLVVNRKTLSDEETLRCGNEFCRDHSGLTRDMRVSL